MNIFFSWVGGGGDWETEKVWCFVHQFEYFGYEEKGNGISMLQVIKQFVLPERRIKVKHYTHQ